MYGGVPTRTVKACEYSVPTVPPGNGDAVKTESDVGLRTVSEKFFDVEVEAVSTINRLTVKTPGTSGVPLRTPASLNDNPLGRLAFGSKWSGTVPPLPEN